MARDLTWSQGGLLKVEDHGKACLPPIKPDDFWMIVSHDCDLASETNEPDVEVMLASKLDSPDPNHRNLKNPRILDVTLRDDASDVLHLRLTQNSKKQIARQICKATCSQLGQWVLDDAEFSVLKQWLGMRYNRPAFPEKFESHFRRQFKNKTTVKQAFDAVLKEHSTDLLSVYFDLNDARRKELEDGDAYDLRIILVYADSGKVGNKAPERLEKAKNVITNIFHSTFGIDGNNAICLESCRCQSDTQVTLADLRKWDSWHTDAISSKNKEDVGLFTSGGAAP